MRQSVLSDGRLCLVYDYRGKNGATHIKGTLPAGSTIAEIIKAKAALVEKAERRSLKFTTTLFENIVDIVVKKNGGAGMSWIYDRIKKDLAGPVDISFCKRYNKYIDKLEDEGKASNTISNHKACIQRCLNTAFKRRMIDDIPIRDYGIERVFRDIVLTPAQRLNLENVMIARKSHLYWSIRLAEKRPIRGRSDLWRLTRDNYVRFGEGAPYLSLKARKTGLNTIIPLSDLPEIVEYLNNALPNDCPYLFPHLTGDIESIHDFAGMKRSKWSIMGNPRKHFSWLLKRAGIEDFHFHDLKRMATTFMIENGYSADDLLDLGMYATRDMIDRCYKKRDALQVLRRISVAPEVAFRANDSSIAL